MRRCASGVVAAISMMVVLGGCVQAESTRYRGTMSRSVAPERTVSADVGVAFGLRSGEGAVVSLTAVTE